MTSSLFVSKITLIFISLQIYSHGLPMQRGPPITTSEGLDADLWRSRVDAAWRIVKTSPCKKVQYGENCSAIRSRKRSDMLLYTASSTNPGGKLVTVLVEKVRGKIKGHHAVLVVDPYPEAHFGHTVIVFLVEYHVSKFYCRQKEGEILQVGTHRECIYIGRSESCRNRIGHGRKGRRRCEINFLPLVYNDGDTKFSQRLSCRSGFANFGQCPVIISSSNDRCSNSGRCSSSSKLVGYRGFRWLCLEKCDHAVLISGGWNSLMNKPRHLENLKATWMYFKSKGFLERNMKIFFANNGTVDIDGNKKTRDTVPATESSGILKYIESVCSMGPHCVDTLAIYLNGPTLMNGNLLLWDRNGDGIADGTEMLRVRDLLQKLQHCNVSWINIIADQNYAGHLVESIWESYAQSDTGSAFRKISVYAASNKRTYTWKNDFTKTWIARDNAFRDTGSQSTARRMNSVYTEVKRSLSSEFSFSNFEAPGGRLRTINGKEGEEVGCSLNQPWDISTQLFRFPRGAGTYPAKTGSSSELDLTMDSLESSEDTSTNPKESSSQTQT